MKHIISKNRAKGKTFAIYIVKRIISETGVDIRTEGRSNEEAFLRAVFFKVCEELTFLTLKEIGDLVNRKHSQVIRSREMFSQLDKKYLDLYYCLVLDLTFHEWKAREHEQVKLRNLKLEEAFDKINIIINKNVLSIIDLKRELKNYTNDLKCK